MSAPQEIWDAINVDLQQILDDVSCWEGDNAERMCVRLEAAIARLNAALASPTPAERQDRWDRLGGLHMP